MAFITISLEVPGALSRISKGGLQWNSDALAANLKLADKKIQAIYVQSIGEGATATREMAVRELNSKLTCARRFIEKRVTSERVTTYRPRGTVRILSRRIPLAAFNPIQTEAGVSVQTGERTRFYKGAFGPNIPRLSRGVYMRASRKRKPLRQMQGVSLVRVANGLGLTERLQVFFRSTVRRKINDRLRLLDLFGTAVRRVV